MSIKVKPGQIWAWKAGECWAGDLVIVVRRAFGHMRWECLDFHQRHGPLVMMYDFSGFGAKSFTFELVQDV